MEGYLKDAAWLRFQNYLPKEGRFTGKTLPKEEEFSCGKFRVHTDHYLPGNPEGTAVLVHGLGQNGRCLSFLAVRLLKEGFEVYCPDLPFFGYTVCDGTPVWEDWTGITAFTAKKAMESGRPVYLIGIGLGGLAVYETAGTLKGIAGVAATAFPEPSDEILREQFAGSPEKQREVLDTIRRWQWLLPGKKIALSDVADLNRMTLNPDACGILAKDAHAGGSVLQLRFLQSLIRHELSVKPEEFGACPVFLALPGKDAWISVEKARGFFDRIAGEKEEIRLEEAGHLPIEPEATDQLVRGLCDFMRRNR